MSGVTRRDILRGAALLGLGSAAGASAVSAHGGDTVWQIDPYVCIQCGKCSTNCVLEESAVKAVHVHALCGHCNLCTAFFEPASSLHTGAENQLCPTGAIEQALQLLQRSCRICRNMEPFPNIAQPFTHLPQPTQGTSSIS